MAATPDKPASKPPASSVTITQLRNGQWTFALKFRGVSHPAQGQFSSRSQAEAFGLAALKALEAPKA